MPLTCANALLFLAILIGARLHRRRTLHARWMGICFVLDLGLLAWVEFGGTSAVMEAAHRVFDSGHDRLLTIVHVAFAATGLVLWFPLIVLGRRLLAGREEARALHKAIVPWFLLCRLGNAVTAFFVV